MNKVFYLFLLVSIISSYNGICRKIEISSPDKQILFTLQINNGSPEYSIKYKSTDIIKASPLSLEFDGFSFRNWKILKPSYYQSFDDYELITGKSSKVHDAYSEIVIPFIQNTPSRYKINLIVRAFNDGFAFRYSFPEQANWKDYILKDEHSTFKFIEDPIVHALLLPSFTTSHEGYYTTAHLSGIKEDTLMDMPTLFELPGNIFVAITEAALLNYAGMYLVKH
ncbi:MAG: glycoside hydrolase family 97 N-terminal domain-containing protein, partial [Flavisolibacter sp.]